MNLTLDKSDLTALTPAQQAAIVDSLFLTIAIDRKLEPKEVAEYNARVRTIPWTLDDKTLDMVLERARIRVKASGERTAWQYWVKEIGMTLTSPQLREKLLGTMAKLAINTGTVVTAERELLNAFAGAFELSMDRLAEIRAQVVNDALAK